MGGGIFGVNPPAEPSKLVYSMAGGDAEPSSPSGHPVMGGKGPGTNPNGGFRKLGVPYLGSL